MISRSDRLNVCFRSRSRSRICAWIVTSSAVVGSSAIDQRRPAGERHRDQHALAQAAGELMRIIANPRRGVGNSDGGQQIDRLRARLAARRPAVDDQRLRHLIANREHGIERGHRLLEDERDLGAADLAHPVLVERQQIAVLEDDAAAGDAARRLHEPHDRQARSPTCRCPIRRRGPAFRRRGSRSSHRRRPAPAPAAVSNDGCQLLDASEASVRHLLRHARGELVEPRARLVLRQAQDERDITPLPSHGIRRRRPASHRRFRRAWLGLRRRRRSAAPG